MDENKVCLKEYIESRIKGLEKAVDVASTAMEKRLEGMNEFRDQLKDQTSTFMTKDQYDTGHKTLQTQVDELRLSKAELAGKASQSSVNIAFIISIISLLMGLVGLISKFF